MSTATSTSSSVWNPDNIRDVAESIGLNALPPEVVDHLTRDVEFRVAQVIEEALKFMRHGKRTVLHTQDISQALRVLDVEPLYGYESTRPLRFGEASIGPGQSLFYIEDEEVDFEKLINAPLPKVPREMTFTAHWLAVEGVQPSIPQNPTSIEAQRQTEQNGLSLLPKGSGAAGTAPGPGGAASGSSLLAATAGADNLSVKPLVKHILSKELQHYFSHVTSALLSSPSNPPPANLAANASNNGNAVISTSGNNASASSAGGNNSTSDAVPNTMPLLLTESDESSLRSAALNSLRTDPGLHQLIPYFVQFVSEKVTHNLKSLFVLTQMLNLVAAILDNPNLHITPYISALVPPVITCLVGKRLGPPASSLSSANGNGNGSMVNGSGANGSYSNGASVMLPEHYALRRLAASVLQSLTRPAFVAATPTLKPRLARSLLMTLLSTTNQPLGVYFGAILGLSRIGGPEGTRKFLFPYIKPALDDVLKEAVGTSDNGAGNDESSSNGTSALKKREGQEIVDAVLAALDQTARLNAYSGFSSSVRGGEDVDMGDSDETREKVITKLGTVIGAAVMDTGRQDIIQIVLQQNEETFLNEL